MIVKNKVLTIDDVQALNDSNDAKVILANTVGQSADIIRKLKPHVTIQVVGGYDGEKKEKYKEQRIVRRTFYSAEDLASIIEKYEELERGVDRSWGDLEKAFYVYLQLAKNIKYQDAQGDQILNLNVIRNGFGVCAGYASVYKEAMDRIGVESDIVNDPKTHTWNVIKIDGVLYPVDLTWDSSSLQKGGNEIKWFGQNANFSKYRAHDVKGEQQIPDNCFEEEMLTKALKEVGGKELTLKFNRGIAFEDVEKLITIAKTQDNVEVISDSLKKISEYALSVITGFRTDVYVEMVDPIFKEIYVAVEENSNLSEQEKSNCLTMISNLREDVVPKLIRGINDESLKAHKSKISNKSVVEQKINISKPVQIIDANPATERDFEKYYKWRIGQLEELLDEIKNSGCDNVEGITLDDVELWVAQAKQCLIDEQARKKWEEEHKVDGGKTASWIQRGEYFDGEVDIEKW